MTKSSIISIVVIIVIIAVVAILLATGGSKPSTPVTTPSDNAPATTTTTTQQGPNLEGTGLSSPADSTTGSIDQDASAIDTQLNELNSMSTGIDQGINSSSN